MKVKDLRTGKIHLVFQTVYVDEGDCSKPGTRCDTYSYDDDGGPLQLWPGEWEEVDQFAAVTGNEYK